MKSFEDKSRNSYNLKANHYDETFEGKFTEKFKKMLIEDIVIETNHVILDVACGNGKLLHMLSDQYNFKGYGIDISEKMIENAKKRCPGMIFHTSPCEHTPFQSQTFDVITVCAAYHHFPDTKAFAQEVNRILRPEGTLYIADVYYSLIIRAICNPFVPFSKAGDVKFYSPREIKSNFESYGLKQIGFKKSENVQVIKLQKIHK